MSTDSKRKSERVEAVLTSYIRKTLPDGGYALMQFVSKDMSEGGIFVVTDNLSVFDLSEEVSLIVEKEKAHYFEGTARVVRSARVFQTDGDITESGFGLMFLEADDDFKKMVAEEVARHSSENGSNADE